MTPDTAAVTDRTPGSDTQVSIARLAIDGERAQLVLAADRDQPGAVVVSLTVRHDPPGMPTIVGALTEAAVRDLHSMLRRPPRAGFFSLDPAETRTLLYAESGRDGSLTVTLSPAHDTALTFGPIAGPPISQFLGAVLDSTARP